jgi:integrase
MADEEDPSTPPDIRECAAIASDSLLPTHSRLKYERTLASFYSWKSEKGIHSSLVTENIVLAYLFELSTSYAPSTMWTLYSMLNKMVQLKEGVNISTFPKVLAFLKKGSSSYKSKKSAIFSRDHIEQFIRTADNEKYLHVKVIILFSLYGALRKSEILSLTASDVTDAGQHLFVKIRASKTGPRSFVIVGSIDPLIDALDYYRKYIQLRPEGAPSRLFIGFRNGKCTRQPIGINKVASYSRLVADFLKLENAVDFTSHAFRRSSATWVADSGVDMINLKRFGGWKSETAALGYVAESTGNKRKLAEALQGETVKRSVEVTTMVSTSATSPHLISVNTGSNCTLNITINGKQ